ncbi:hypothetical protein C8K18_114171 [Paraburkholderia sp. GV068]|jgi:hypothetical protein|nr:hypothetical protein [Paraburkholderia graminis]PTQ96354.1 hypothetical protein C8K19_110104 [Paraburkholderia sp. GV072]PUB00909.1 hypothetical protein C8K18_114171 [Paraburkholderia sp. GV068]
MNTNSVYPVAPGSGLRRGLESTGPCGFPLYEQRIGE